MMKICGVSVLFVGVLVSMLGKKVTTMKLTDEGLDFLASHSASTISTINSALTISPINSAPTITPVNSAPTKCESTTTLYYKASSAIVIESLITDSESENSITDSESDSIIITANGIDHHTEINDTDI